MQKAVMKALYKKGIKRNHKAFKDYSKELYDLSMRGVKVCCICTLLTRLTYTNIQLYGVSTLHIQVSNQVILPL